MQLLLITTPNIVSADATTANRLFGAGLQVLHVRKPTADKQALRTYLEQLDPRYLNRVVLHQHHELAPEFGLKGIHFKEQDRPAPPIGRQFDELTQSTSFHTTKDVIIDWQHLDYAFLSPIFDSISKEGYQAAFDLKGVAIALQMATLPVYALGGITADKLPAVKQMGFAGVGILGAVWARDDPVAAFREFQQLA